MCRGGWPDTLELEEDIALEASYDYLDGIVNSDISRVDNVTRDPERARRIMRSYARNQGTQIAFTEIAEDIDANRVFKELTKTGKSLNLKEFICSLFLA